MRNNAWINPYFTLHEVSPIFHVILKEHAGPSQQSNPLQNRQFGASGQNTEVSSDSGGLAGTERHIHVMRTREGAASIVVYIEQI